MFSKNTSWGLASGRALPVLRVAMPSPRCVMVDMQTADLPAQPGNLKAVGRINDVLLGVVAAVSQPGTINIGDVAVPL